jgi:hypothetical protein
MRCSPPATPTYLPTLLRTFSQFTGIVVICLLIGGLGGFFPGKHAGVAAASDRSKRLPNASIPCKPGPWGDLSYTQFTIAAPDDMVPVRTIEAGGTQWFLAGYTADTFISLLQSTTLAPELQQQFLSPSVFHALPNGIELTPSPDLIFALPEDARGKIYQVLAKSPENDGQMNFVAKDMMGEQFSSSGISNGTMGLFRKLCYERGDYLMFSGVAALLSRIPTYEEKLAFAKALTRQRTMLLNLHVTPQSDVDALTQYWDRGCWGTDVRTIFQSLKAIPNGTYMNIMMVLPDLPSAEIYDYPNIVDNPLVGPPVNRDCAWTSLNFFRDVPDPDFGKKDAVLKELNDNYEPVKGEPRYGDLVLVARPDGFLIHLAIYIADDIWFTKNGSNLVHPWMLSTSSDVLKQFQFQINPDQQLTIRYYRNKHI